MVEMFDEYVKEAEDKMDKTIAAVEREFSTIRTGRAAPSLLDRVPVETYGSQMPVNQVATVSVPDPHTLIVQPWDKSIIADVEKAILGANIGLTPVNDGNVIRINVPRLTEERRKEMVKLAKQFAEEGKVAIRRVRGDANKHIKTAEKEKGLSEDASNDAQEKVQSLTDEYCEKIDELLNAKEEEILEI
jgi:ribosome recycling factor